MRSTRVPLAIACSLALLCTGCEYLRLLRPSVVRQINPRTARLVNYLPKVDHPNEALLGRLFAHGGLSRAEVGADGVMRSRLRVRMHAMLWEPAVIVLPRPGTLEVEVANEDEGAHIAYFPDDAADQVLVLPAGKAGRVRVNLDAPGMYTFADPISNNSGQGMLGIIIVEGDVPPEARIARPPQRRPGQ
ncbi:MAG TPA: MSMEG_3727 family PQQ-associated protein [Longimicrobium sp.]|jgi:PQQ system protein